MCISSPKAPPPVPKPPPPPPPPEPTIEAESRPAGERRSVRRAARLGTSQLRIPLPRVGVSR